MKGQVKVSVGRSVGYSVAESVGEIAATITPSASFQGLLDVYGTTGLLAALSVGRRLTVAYTGPLIRVRRSSDNVETDIGYVDSTTAVLNLSALTDFVGSNDGRVVTVYDQSGNGRNWTQATAANQPFIVTTGVVQTCGVNARPGMQHTGSHRMNTVSFSANANQVAVFFVNQKETNPAYNVKLCWGNVFTTGLTWHFEDYNQTVTWRPRSGVDASVVGVTEWNSATATVDLIQVGIANLTTGLRQHNVNQRGTISAVGGSFTATVANFGPRSLLVGSETGGGSGFVGNVGECIFYNVAARASASAGIANNLHTFWGSTA